MGDTEYERTSEKSQVMIVEETTAACSREQWKCVEREEQNRNEKSQRNNIITFLEFSVGVFFFFFRVSSTVRCW